MPAASAPALPSVSVVIPAYNAERFILEALRGVRAQHYPALEVLVVDDGSTDGTAALLAREAPDVRIIRQPNAGAAAARNTGLRSATGEFICLLDADDGWFPGKLNAQARYLQSHPDVGAVYHDWLVWASDVDGVFRAPPPPANSTVPPIDESASGWIYTQLLLDSVVHTSTIMIRRSIVKQVGEFDTKLVTGEDYDYWLRVSRQCEIHKLAATYSYYRQSPGSLTSSPKDSNNEYTVVAQAVERWGLASPDGHAMSPHRVRRRLGQLAFDFGYQHYHHGSRAIAGNSFRLALRHQPWNWRAAVYLSAIALQFPSLAH